MRTVYHHHSDNNQLKPADLRGILEYVPLFRDHVFVIALDGSIIAHENFSNVLTDIAVLRSLNIQIIIVHGIGQQLNQLAETRQVTITDAYGEGPTDPLTLSLAIETSGIACQAIMAGLTQNGIKCAVTNAIRATQVGVIHGTDQQLTGKIEKIDLGFLQRMISDDIVPIIQPIAYDREGNALRANSDLLASELALSLNASKLIYLTSKPGLKIKGKTAMNIPLEQLNELLKKNIESIDERIRSKAVHAARTLTGGTPRAHILDGRIFGGLLTEIFDKVGLGTMIHANEYQQIRPARKKDVQSIFNIVKNASKSEALRHRTRQSIEKDIGRFFVYEVDESIIGCISLLPYGDAKTAELASVLVQPFYQGKGVGKKLVEFAKLHAQSKGLNKLVALSTQTASFFETACGFKPGKLDDLSKERQQAYAANGRNSKILIIQL